MNRFATLQQLLKPKTGEIALSWTGQAGFSFKDASGLVIHVDPYLSNVCSRYVGYHRVIEPPASAEAWRGDRYLFTHDHRDHLDEESVPVIAANNPDALFYGPPSCISRLLELGLHPKRLITVRRGESKKIGDARIRAVLAVHTEDSVGYILTIGGTKVYITGDTVYSDELIGIAGDRPDLMMCCINGRLGCMNIEDAVRLASHIQPAIAVPMHVHMFAENTASPEEFVRQAKLHSGITQGIVMEHGVWYFYGQAQGWRKAEQLEQG
ncbi:MBL fold metallo-hydrolase [Cohnella lubricantis]|uniref:MBL fold metallo-hydrolase n=1 Tax=Cohnella lubricantis TaxID=2163172 RepID=A0A841TDU9_9BACL|nr:MBL fold metallo-hydrolase [Cohnella lubricantis]MBB6678406.1 MBL fold metallo-hydrolase [Cohnella lubricantis]MBP2116786.1 L-ascorbate 6-phosphate lactonase [Cohnella lubricantis]